MIAMEVSNVRGAGRVVSDYTTFKDSAGFSLELPSTKCTGFTAGGTVVRGNPVIFKVTASGTPLRVEKAGNSAVGHTIRGIALNNAVAGGYLDFCVFGFCWVLVASGDAPAFGDYGIPSATGGEVDLVAAASAPDASTITGTVLGLFLGAKDSGLLAPFWYDRS